MKTFIEKYGGRGHEAYDAIDVMDEQWHKIKEKVERGDSNVRNELSVLSNMIDEFLQHSQNVEFKPRPYHNPRYGGKHGMNPGQHQNYDPRRYIGYEYDQGQPQGHYPMYPIWWWFGEGDRGRYGREGYGRDDYPDYPHRR